MASFYVDPHAVRGDGLALSAEEGHHLRVRRHKPGDVIDVIDGEGSFFEARIDSMEREGAFCTILSRSPGKGECAVDLSLAVAMPKGQGRFDSLIEKVTEVGVGAIVPTMTERSIATSGSGAGKSPRWRRIALAATKQCGRSRAPHLREVGSFTEALELVVGECHSVFLATLSPDAGDLSSRVTPAAGVAIGLLVGPEGGFSAVEEQAAVNSGATLIRWANRTMRTDTAAAVLSALILDRR